MVSAFYKHNSGRILLLVALTFPFLMMKAESLPSNNDIETWLPRESAVRTSYEQFKRDFGNEELIVIAIPNSFIGDPIVEATCERIERLPGIRSCWTPSRMQDVMAELDVPPREIRERLSGLAVSRDGKLVGIVAQLSDHGLAHRGETVADLRSALEYCQLEGDAVHLAGAPVVVAELDRLGSQENNKKFFVITLLISLVLLYNSIRQWKLTLTILGLTIWSINATLASIALAGGEMNFILGALTIMVMVFTMAISIHFLHYYQTCRHSEDPLGAALSLAWKPCALATLTTTIGLISLAVSDIGPVSQFGYAAAAGSIIAMLTGLGLTPAAICVFPYEMVERKHRVISFSRLSRAIIDHSRVVTCVTLLLVSVTCVGLFHIRTKIDPLDFLPKQGKVLNDVLYIQEELCNTSTIEAVVDFGVEDVPFVEKLARVRALEERIQQDPDIDQTMSLATFFPTNLPDNSLAVARLLNRASQQQGENDFLAYGDRMWRISARLKGDCSRPPHEVHGDLVELLKGEPIRFTGIAPLLQQAQTSIFKGFWESFATAFLIISVVMMLSLRSFRAGAVAMIPNLTPICIVFGVLGWSGYPVDIGMMMTASIALGIAVDGTFHFLVRYQEHYRAHGCSTRAAHHALNQTGEPIFKAAVITGIGMLALTLSSFAPTIRFGYLMATLLVTALLGDLVLLPSLLALRPERDSEDSQKPDAESSANNPPHFHRPKRVSQFSTRVA